jgi:hypothetical protein
VTSSESGIWRIMTRLGGICTQIGHAVAATMQMMWPRTLRKPPPLYYKHIRFAVDTPTREQAVTFQVDVIGLWTGQGTEEVVLEHISRNAPLEEQRVRKELRELSRAFTPAELADFEKRADEQLGEPASFEDGLLECHFSIEVSPDQVLQDHQRKTWEKMAGADADHKLKERALGQLQPLQERWLNFLRDLEADPLGALAVQLADNPSQLAEIIGRRTTEREYLQKELKRLCDTTSDAYREMGVFDFVVETDGALATLIRHLGIDKPTTAPGSSQDSKPPPGSPNGHGPSASMNSPG